MASMRSVFFLPVDALAKNLAARLREDGWDVHLTQSFQEFRRNLDPARLVIVNISKFDDAKYVLKIFFATLLAWLKRKKTILLLTIDPVDICDQGLFRVILFLVNLVLLRLPSRVILLRSRAHIAQRYHLRPARVVFAENFALRELWGATSGWQPPEHEQPETIRFFYHGELLWWHGIEQFSAILDELKKHCTARIVVAGNLYPTNFQILGIPLCKKEIEIKKRIRQFLQREDVLHLGRIGREQIIEEMLQSDFHVSQLRTGDLQAESELRTCLLEAMALGMPCLHAATRALASHAGLRDGENIIVLDPREPASCAERILSLYRSPEAVKRISKAARHTVDECFDFEKWFVEFREQHLSSLIQTPSHAETLPSPPLLDILTRPLLVPLYLGFALASYPCLRLVKLFRTERTPAAPQKETVGAAEPRHFEKGNTPLPGVSVVVPALNAERTIEACIDSLLSQHYPREQFEIIVVDNGSTDRTRELVGRQPVRIIEEPRRGAGTARNAGVRAARHRLIAFIDADCVAHPDWLGQLVRRFTDGAYDAVGGAILGSDLPAEVEKFYKTYAILDQEKAVAGEMLPLPFVITANGLFRRESFERVGGFDENFPEAAAEDVDLSWRITGAGGALGYCADAIVYHRHRITGVDLYFQFYKYGHSEMYLYKKHWSRLQHERLRQMLWIRWQDYRCFWRMLGAMFYNAAVHPAKSRQNLLYLLKELGHVCGRLHAHLHWK